MDKALMLIDKHQELQEMVKLEPELLPILKTAALYSSENASVLSTLAAFSFVRERQSVLDGLPQGLLFASHPLHS